MSPQDIHFKTCVSAYNCLLTLGPLIETKHGSNGDWRITFEEGLRGFAARVFTVIESLRSLDKPFDFPIDDFSPEQWAIETDSRIGEILFGMDSALECVVFALNAIGYLKLPSAFCDITTEKGRKQINPDNVAHCNPMRSDRTAKGYSAIFPRIATIWKTHCSLICEIMEYHDTSKHRSCIIQVGTRGNHFLPDQPKKPGSRLRTASRTVEAIVDDFHRFAEALFVEIVEEISTVFDVPVVKINRD